MANTDKEMIRSFAASGTTIYDGTGLTVADGTYGAAATTDLDSAVHENRPLVNINITVTFSVAPAAASKTIELRYRNLNVDGVNGEPVPDGDNYDGHFLASFAVDGGTGAGTTQYLREEGIDCPKDAEVYYINRSGQQVTAMKIVVESESAMPYTA